MRRLIFPIILGLGGVAILLSLGIWQVQRLAWKEGVLAEIEARIDAAPVAVPAAATEAVDEYRPVTVTGTLTGDEHHVLTSAEDLGPGYRNIAVLALPDDRRILVDLGYIALDAKEVPRRAADVTVTGHLLWPDEVDGWTPDPDAGRNIWFARDVPAMAASLETEEILVVMAQMSGGDFPVTPLPIDTSSIPNDHLNYAITWFLLALVWAVMSGAFAWRMARPSKDEA